MSSYFRCLLNRDGCPLLHTNIKFRWQSYDIPRHDIVFGPVTYVGRWYLDDAHRLLTVESGFGTKTTQLGPLLLRAVRATAPWQGFNLLRGSPTHVLEHLGSQPSANHLERENCIEGLNVEIAPVGGAHGG